MSLRAMHRSAVIMVWRFLYPCPKADKYLRDDWDIPYPTAILGRLIRLSQVFKRQGIDFGIGFSPNNIPSPSRLIQNGF